MKTLDNFKKYTVMAGCILLIASCETTESEIEQVEAIDQEGFMSTTGNSNTIVNENQSGEVKPLLHMRFGADVSREEAAAKFDEAVKEYLSKNNNSIKGPILTDDLFTKWHYEIVTITGKHAETSSHHNGTDGPVRIAIDFLTDLGVITKENMVLNNPGNDREEGSWDFYYFDLYLPNPVNIKWIEVESAAIRLKGTDGWYLKELAIISNSDEGYTSLGSRPKKWLDSDCNNCWDTFYTNDSDTTSKWGRYEF